MKDRYIITVNSITLYVIAFLLTTIVHELAHAFAGLLYNGEPVLHHNYVEHLTDHLSIRQQVIIALAGPIASLIQGIIAGIVYFKSKRRGLIELFILWFFILGMFNFLGYLMTGPMFQSGDIGKVHLLLNIPLLIQILIACVGAAILLIVAYKLTTPFLEFSYEEAWTNSIKSRKSFSFHILIMPWIIGSMLVTVLYLPIVAIVSIIYPFMSGMVLIFPWQNAARIENIVPSNNKSIGQISAVSLFILGALIIVFRFFLLPGIKI